MSSKKKKTPINQHPSNTAKTIHNIFDIEALREQTDFTRYTEFLKKISNRYTILISSVDTPIGPHFTQTMAEGLSKLGIMLFTAQVFRKSYAAVIHKGELIFEKVGSNDMECVSYDGEIGDTQISIRSMGFSNGELANIDKATLGIFIDSEKCSPSERGLSIVVFDAKTRSILDICNFDSFGLDKCIHYNDVTIESLRQNFLEWVNRHPEIIVLSCNTPSFPDQHLTQNEQHIIDNNIDCVKIIQNLHNLQYSVLHKYVDNSKELAELIIQHEAQIDVYGVPQFKNKQSRLINFMNGLRVTTNQPKKHKRAVYYIGPSYAVGTGVQDRCTIASVLQHLFNTIVPEQEIIVHNYSCYYQRAAGANLLLLLRKIQSINAKQGDIVIIHERTLSNCNEIPFIDISDLFMRPHAYGEVFFDKSHYTEEGNRVIAEHIFEYIKANVFNNEITVNQGNTNNTAIDDLGLPTDTMEILESYKEILTEFYHSMFPRPLIGAVVMNCNPFTIGHRYLIEQALEKVDYLMIFVVQEDKSYFSFDDRIALVIAGTSDLPNVSVIPSGQFIISSLTFTEYFNKSDLQDRTIDCSVDVRLFGKEIAPCLDIRVRFIGEEPCDNVTKQYNELLKETLPYYGVDVVEVPRKEQAGEVISASKVRELLKLRDWGAIETIVPKCTYEYLIENYK